MSLLQLSNVAFSQGSLSILRDISLSVRKGERLVVMGKSGAGKSTLLRVMAGLQVPTTGQVLLQGNPLSRISPSDRNIAMLTQDYALYPQMTVQQNLQAATQRQKVDSALVIERMESLVRLFGIGELMNRLPSQISGGQAQRVAMAKALIRKPQLLLLDEPFSQLDNQLHSQLVQSLMIACEQLELTLCCVSHDPREAFRIATRIIVLNDGVVEQDGTPQSIYTEPSSVLVAELCSLWPINWIDPVDPIFQNLLRFSKTEHRLIGLRAEQLIVGRECDSNWPRIDVNVERIEFLGSYCLVHGTVGSRPLDILTMADHAKEIQQSISVAIDPSNLIYIK